VASQGCLVAGNVAVITGGGSGIGRATALRCARAGMRVVLADVHEADLESVAAECRALAGAENSVLAVPTDVRELASVQALQQRTWAKFGGCNFLMNNAAVQTNGRCSPYSDMDRWEQILRVNLYGVVHGCQAFVQPMLDSGLPGVIVNTGSKQGITMPPGDAAYNVSKSGVKTLTEALQHSLRSVPGGKLNAFLLVPGWTITMIATKGSRWIDGAGWDEASKAQDERAYDGVADPAVAEAKLTARGAWPASKVVDTMWQAIEDGKPFYVICPDHETTKEQDDGRMQWAADDLIFRRVPLSRWSPEYKEEYSKVSASFGKA